MSVDISRLKVAVASLRRTLDDLGEAADLAVETVDQERAFTEAAAAGAFGDLSLPTITVDPDDFPGAKAMTKALQDVIDLPKALAETQDQMFAAVGAFEARVAELAQITEAINDRLDERSDAFDALMDDAEDMMSDARDSLQDFIDAAAETITQTLEEDLESRSSTLFAAIENNVQSLFDEALDAAVDGATAVAEGSAAVNDAFDTEMRRFNEETLKAGFERIVEAVLSEVLEEVATSQTLAAAVQQINVAIASAAPQMAAGLKAFGAIKRAKELASI